MVTTLKRYACVAALLFAPAIALAAGGWTGPYAGVQVGINSASMDRLSTEQGLTAGVYGGYNYQFTEHFVLGADAFWNWNQSKSHTVNGTSLQIDTGTNVYGADVLAGFPLGPMNDWMPYAKAGYGWGEPTGDLTGGTQDSWRYGAGVAWRVHTNLAVNFQYMHQNFGGSNSNYTNDNFTVGASWHF